MLSVMSVDATTIIEENLQAPASAAADGRSASQHSLSEQIKAAQFIAAQSALETNEGDGWSTVGRRVGKPTGAV